MITQHQSRIGSTFVGGLLALGLLLLALPITFYQLDAQSLWLDEGTTQAYVTTHHIGVLLLDLVRPTQAYPLYHLVVKATTRALGDSEWALRLPSAVAGALAVPALYLLGAELRGRAVGLAAAALLIISPWALRQAQDAKVYSLALLMTIVLALLWARVLRLGTRRAWLLWGGAALLAPFVHRLLVLPLLGCATCWAALQPPRRRRPALLLVAIAAAILVGGIRTGLQYYRAGAQFEETGPLRALGLTFARWTVGQFSGDVPPAWFVPFGLLLMLGALHCVRDLWRGWARPPRDAGNHDHVRAHARGALVLLLMGGVPLALFLILLRVQRVYETRYLVAVYPFWLLLLAWSVTPGTTWERARNAWTWSAGVGIVLIVAALLVQRQALLQPERGLFSGAAIKEDYRAAVRYLAKHVHPDDLVIVHPDAVKPLYDYYARRVADFPLPAARTYPQLGRAKGFDRREFDMVVREDLQRHKRAWLLVAPDHASLVDPPLSGDTLGLVGLAFQYGDQNRRIQCGERHADRSVAGFVGLQIYCNNIPDIQGKIPQPERPITARFADELVLHGYTITPWPTGIRPGSTLPITLFWEPLRSLEGTDYIIFAHLTLPDNPRPLAQVDGRPMEGGLPTGRWTQPHARLHDDRTIVLPDHLAPGRYVLRVGVYRADDARQLHVETTAPVFEDAVVLGEVQVVP